MHFLNKARLQQHLFFKCTDMSGLSWSTHTHYNDMCDSCQARISRHQSSEENSTGAKGQHCLGGDPGLSKYSFKVLNI